VRENGVFLLSELLDFELLFFDVSCITAFDPNSFKNSRVEFFQFRDKGEKVFNSDVWNLQSPIGARVVWFGSVRGVARRKEAHLLIFPSLGKLKP